jgi:hypothetical protein
MEDKMEHCTECGEPCDGSFKNDFEEPLCVVCAEELGYDG